MAALKLLLLSMVVWFSMDAQDTRSTSLDSRAAQLRRLLRESPRLPVEEIPLLVRLPGDGLLGTVSSVGVGRNGVIYVLQRGDKADPVIAVNRDGDVLRSWGKGMFTVPHSVRIDPDGNIWTVDAGSSVLLKFSADGTKLQQIDVGEVASGKDCAFPTLCGTTDITFAPGGRLFISDGYGNARILEYNSAGRRVNVWGSKGTEPGQFRIPHGIVNDGKVLYVADRENARIQRFDFDGHYIGEWTHLGRPFALDLNGGALWVALMTLEVAGPGQSQGSRPSPWIVKVDVATGKILAQVQAPGPHSIAISDGGDLFVNGCCGGLNPTGVYWLRRTPAER
jgi:DNA-binding beta-propeller fold protein YncE